MAQVLLTSVQKSSPVLSGDIEYMDVLWALQRYKKKANTSVFPFFHNTEQQNTVIPVKARYFKKNLHFFKDILLTTW